MKLKHLYILLIIAGVVGTVIFFPVNINNHYTCLFDVLQNNSDISIEARLQEMHKAHHNILSYYLKCFAFYWWGSILLLVLGIYLLERTIRYNHI